MRRITLILTAILLSACGAVSGSAGQPAANPSPSQVALTCTPSGEASASWPAPQTASGSGPAILSVAVSGDTLKLTFAAGTPQFEVQPQASAHFFGDPQGQPIDLKGAAGVRIVLRGFRGDLSNYDGQSLLTSSGPLLLQVRKTGDFEGVVSFAAGVSAPACASVTADASSLTFHFIPAP